MTKKIGFLSDTHIDYSSGRKWTPDGVNQRVKDGHDALAETVTQMIDAEVDIVVHGGDLFHGSIPTVRGIVAVREQFDRFYRAGIPVIGITGNHDFPNTRLRLPATASVNDPDRGITLVTDPMAVVEIDDGLRLHLLGHAGLISEIPERPTPTSGEVNILVSHGAADIEGHEIFHCVDSPAEAVISRDLLEEDFNLTLLGHYHNQGPLPKLKGTRNRAYYAGSALRRGFSDAKGHRGWLLVEVEPDGTITVTEQRIAQRAQYDLSAINARGMSGEEVEAAIRENLSRIDLSTAPIVRQKVLECPLATRRGVDVKALNDMTAGALSWQLEFQRPTLTESDSHVEAVEGLHAARRVSLPDAWKEFVTSDPQITVEMREEIAERGRALLEGESS